MSQPFVGLVAAAHTPFVDRHGQGAQVALDVVPALARHLAGDRLEAVFVAGATGEGASLAEDERLALFEAWAAAGREHGLRVIAHVGGDSLRAAARLAGSVAAIDGIHAIAAIAPSAYRPESADLVARSLAEIAVAAGDLPLYAYDIPALTGIVFPARELAAAFGLHVPQLRGVKCSRYEGWHVQDYLAAHEGQYDVLAGTDEALLSALALGVRGAVGSTYNFAAPLFHSLLGAFDAGDLPRARELQLIGIDLVRSLAPFGYLAASRAVMERLGVPVGPPRLPHAALDAKARRELGRSLDALEFEARVRRGSAR